MADALELSLQRFRRDAHAGMEAAQAARKPAESSGVSGMGARQGGHRRDAGESRSHGPEHSAAPVSMGALCGRAAIPS